MLLQRKAQTLDDRLPEPSGVRRPNEISLGCRQPNRVQAKVTVYVHTKRTYQRLIRQFERLRRLPLNVLDRKVLSLARIHIEQRANRFGHSAGGQHRTGGLCDGHQ